MPEVSSGRGRSVVWVIVTLVGAARSLPRQLAARMVIGAIDSTISALDHRPGRGPV